MAKAKNTDAQLLDLADFALDKHIADLEELYRGLAEAYAIFQEGECGGRYGAIDALRSINQFLLTLKPLSERKLLIPTTVLADAGIGNRDQIVVALSE